MAELNAELLMSAITQILQNESAPEVQILRNELMRRIVEETEVKPTRIPAPLNITEVGGYYNLISDLQAKSEEMELKKLKMQMSMIASALGLPV